MRNVELQSGLIVEVDEETAERLEDPKYRADYTRLVLEQLDEPAPTTFVPGTLAGCSSESTLWRTKQPSRQDHEATLAFLALRRSYDDKFRDKKTCKNNMWAKIRDQLNDMGYFVGTDIAGREKVRQKFANLQSAYLKTKERRKRTGEGSVENCPYYDEIDAILGDKHKVDPVLIMDSLKAQKNTIQPTQSPNSASESPKPEAIPSTSENVAPLQSNNRFSNIKKTVKPHTPRAKALDELVQIQKDNQELRKNEFKSMIEMFSIQNQNRHKETMALIAAFSKRNCSRESKKRKHDSSDDE